jgi:hypothetical protein
LEVTFQNPVFLVVTSKRHLKDNFEYLERPRTIGGPKQQRGYRLGKEAQLTTQSTEKKKKTKNSIFKYCTEPYIHDNIRQNST